MKLKREEIFNTIWLRNSGKKYEISFIAGNWGIEAHEFHIDQIKKFDEFFLNLLTNKFLVTYDYASLLIGKDKMIVRIKKGG